MPSNKSRRKQPYEIEKKDGTKVLTRHGGTITCSYCHEQGHNIKGCNIRKVGILPKITVRRGPRAIPEDVSDDELVMAQDEQEQDGGQVTQEEVHVTQDDEQVTQEEVYVTQDDGQLKQEDVNATQNDCPVQQQEDEYDTPVVFQVQDFGHTMLLR